MSLTENPIKFDLDLIKAELVEANKRCDVYKFNKELMKEHYGIHSKKF